MIVQWRRATISIHSTVGFQIVICCKISGIYMLYITKFKLLLNELANFANSLLWCYIKQLTNLLIRVMERISSLSPRENILALITFIILYNTICQRLKHLSKKNVGCLIWRKEKKTREWALKIRALDLYSKNLRSWVFFWLKMQSTTFFRNVSMTYRTDRYSVFNKAILKVRCFIWNVFYSVGESLEYGL